MFRKGVPESCPGEVRSVELYRAFPFSLKASSRRAPVRQVSVIVRAEVSRSDSGRGGRLEQVTRAAVAARAKSTVRMGLARNRFP